LHAALAETDAWHFTKLTGDAKRVTRDAPTQAVELFRAGLALWRGTSLESDGTGTMWVKWVRQLEEERLAAAEALYDACLRANLHDQIVGELEALCVEYPLRERFYDQLMVALYRCGRQAEALGVYEHSGRSMRTGGA
jgi:DNA-binding SARP family transcriptional activator